MLCQESSTHCNGCGDRLIHQSNRQAHESSSRFGQWVHEVFGRTFFAADIDLVVFKNATRILRVLEHKPLGASLSDGQKRILELIAISVKVLALTRLVDVESGVFIVWADMSSQPWPLSIEVREIGGPSHAVLEGADMASFLTGERLAELFGIAS